jgi:hypothetical protein
VFENLRDEPRRNDFRRRSDAIRFRPKTISPATLVLLLVVCLLSFGPLIAPIPGRSGLGLYWDDWPSLWFLHAFGPTIFPQAFAIDRPLQGWLFVLTTSLLGESMLAWQLFGILARLLSGLAVGWALLSLWPQRKTRVLYVVLLFLAYPGFLQQYIPITYSHQFLIMAAFFVSLGMMNWAVRKPGWYWPLTIASILIALLSMFSLEYFYGLELLRPVFLWILVTEQTLDETGSATAVLAKPESRAKRCGRVALHWLPYLIMDLLFLAWRLSTFTPRGQVSLFERLVSAPLATILELFRTIFQDILEASAVAWARILVYLNPSGVKASVVILYAAIVVVLALLVIFYLSRLDREMEDFPKKQPISSRMRRLFGLPLVLLGTYALLIGGWPFWATGLRIELAFPWDRFTLPMMLGVSLLLVGLLEVIFRAPLPKIILIGILVGLAGGAQLHIALQFRQDWEAQKAFFRQLVWRIPGLQPGTLLLTTDLPFAYDTDNSLTAPVNWIYDNASDPSRQMPYLLYDLNARRENRLPDIIEGQPVQQEYRATIFNGSTSQALVFVYEPPRCLKVIDPLIDQAMPRKPDNLVEAFPLSRPELILTEVYPEATLPASIFGSPPTRPGWCYYFEKADLASQRHNWEQVVALAEDVSLETVKLPRESAYELAPFIQGYAHTGQWEKAFQLSQKAEGISGGASAGKIRYPICVIWQNIAQTTQPDDQGQAIIQKINEQYQCEFP